MVIRLLIAQLFRTLQTVIFYVGAKSTNSNAPRQEDVVLDS